MHSGPLMCHGPVGSPSAVRDSSTTGKLRRTNEPTPTAAMWWLVPAVGHGERLAERLLRVPHPGDIRARAGDEVAAQFHHQAGAGVLGGERLDERVDAGGQGVEVEVALVVEVRHPETASDVDELEVDAEVVAEPAGQLEDVPGVVDDRLLGEDAGAQVDVQADQLHVRVPRPRGRGRPAIIDSSMPNCLGLPPMVSPDPLTVKLGLTRIATRAVVPALGSELVDEGQLGQRLADDDVDAMVEARSQLVAALARTEEDDVLGPDARSQRGGAAPPVRTPRHQRRRAASVAKTQMLGLALSEYRMPRRGSERGSDLREGCRSTSASYTYSGVPNSPAIASMGRPCGDQAAVMPPPPSGSGGR